MANGDVANVSQASLLKFKENFWVLAQQNESVLSNSKAIMYMPVDGKKHNLARMGKFDLVEVTGRNPDKSYTDMSLDNRQFTKKRLTVTVPIDQLTDVNELIADPENDVVKGLASAYNRAIDRLVCGFAGGSVMTGNPDEAPTSKSAEDDGVVTIDATAGLNYGVIQSVTQNSINADLEIADIKGSVILATGKENTSLMSDEKFINNDYLNGNPANAGILNSAGIYDVRLFAGSVAGGVAKTNPILEEKEGKRTCLVLAPNSVAVAVQMNDIRVERNPGKVNTMDVTAELWIGGMRTEGNRVQKIQTTI